MRLYSLVPVPLLLLAYLSSCACTDIGCADGFSLSIQEQGGAPLTAGTYHIEIDLGGELAQCDVSVDSTGMDGCAPLENYELSLWFDAANHAIDLSVFAKHHGFSPQSIEVRIDRDGTIVFEGAVPPQYKTFSPNGESCSPTCAQGNADILID